MRRSLKKNITMTAITAVISQICSLLTALLLPRLFIETFGSECNGVVSTARQFSSYLMLIDTGLYSATCYQFIRAFEENNTELVQDLFETVGRFYRKVACFLLLLVIVISLGYSIAVPTDIPLYMTLYIFLAYTLGTICAYFCFFKYNIVLFADGKQYYIIFATAISTIVALVCQCFLIYWGVPFFWIVAVNPIVLIGRLWFLKRKTLCDHNYLRQRRGNNRAELIEQKWDALVMNISDSMRSFAPIMSISLVWGAAHVSVYTIYESVLHLGSSILVTCLNGLTPSLGRELNKLTPKSCKQFQRICNIVMMMAGIICTCFAAMIMSFINIYIADVGDISYYYPTLAYLLIISVWFLMVRTGYEMLIKALGLIKELRKGAVHEIVIAIIACLFFCMAMGFTYMPLGVILSSAYRTIRMMWFCKKRIYGFCHNKIFEVFVFWGCITFAISAISAYCIPVVHTLWAFIIWAALVGTLSLIIYALIFVLFEKTGKRWPHADTQY